MKRLALAAVAVSAAFWMLTGVAGASTFTIGSVTQPSGSTRNGCVETGFFAQSAGPAGTYTLPAGGQITQWQTDTAGDTPGTAVSLVALAPEAGLYRVEAVDNETIPSPAGGVATFTPSSPITVSEGDILGIGGVSGANCYWSGGSTPLSDVMGLFGTLVLTPGEILAPGASGPLAANVAATVVATEDSAVTTTAQPSTVIAGALALLASTVTDNGPASNPLTLTDVVPAGLKIDSVLSPSGPCTTVGPVVTCTISGLTAGMSAPVDIVVTPSASTFTNTVTVTEPSAATDPVTTNNKSSVTFTAAKAVVTKCIVTKVVNVPLATAKKLLITHGCKVGKVTKTSGGKVAKGDVIKTTPGKGSYPGGMPIAIVESSGAKSKKH